MANEVSQRIKLMNPGNLDEWYGPYTSTANANLAVPASVRSGKTVAVSTSAGIVEYWWRNGSLDVDLVAKNSGGSGTGLELVFNETPIGLVNGANASFVSEFSFIPETVVVTVNGLRIKPIDEFTTSGNNQIQLTFSPTIGELILINYTKA